MRILIVIHRHRLGHWNYDVFYKLDIIDRILGRRPEDYTEYEMWVCPYVQRYVHEYGWKYLGSGDTAHAEDVLREMGLEDEYDLEGLKRYLKKLYPDADIIVYEHPLYASN